MKAETMGESTTNTREKSMGERVRSGQMFPFPYLVIYLNLLNVCTCILFSLHHSLPVSQTQRKKVCVSKVLRAGILCSCLTDWGSR